MFARSLRPLAAKGARQASTKRSSVNGKGALNAIYGAFMKNNMTYVTSIVLAAIAVEAVYGSATTYIWESANRGRLYHHIDWSQFKTDDDEEEEEEEEEEAEAEEAADEGDDVVDDLHDEDEE